MLQVEILLCNGCQQYPGTTNIQKYFPFKGIDQQKIGSIPNHLFLDLWLLCQSRLTILGSTKGWAGSWFQYTFRRRCPPSVWLSWTNTTQRQNKLSAAGTEVLQRKWATMGNVVSSTETVVTGLYAHHYMCPAAHEQASTNLTGGFPGNPVGLQRSSSLCFSVDKTRPSLGQL